MSDVDSPIFEVIKNIAVAHPYAAVGSAAVAGLYLYSDDKSGEHINDLLCDFTFDMIGNWANEADVI